jgi:hypothetical protein
MESVDTGCLVLTEEKLFDILPALKDGDSYGAARCSAGRFGGFLLHRVA